MNVTATYALHKNVSVQAYGIALLTSLQNYLEHNNQWTLTSISLELSIAFPINMHSSSSNFFPSSSVNFATGTLNRSGEEGFGAAPL